MIDKRDQKLDTLLQARRVEPSNRDLAQRIILQAQLLPQNNAVPLWQWLGELFREFHLPKPAYVLTSALLLGMVIGFSTPQDTSQGADDNAAIIQTFLSGDEALYD